MALSFNGTNQYVNITSSVLNSAAITIAAWIRPSALTSTQSVICSTNSVSGGYRAPFAILLNTTKLNMQMTYQSGTTLGQPQYATVTLASPNTLVVNTWVHVALTFASGTVLMYENGRQVATTTTTFTPLMGDDACLGADRSAAATFQAYFSGMIEDFRIYTRALSGNELLTIATLRGRDTITLNQVVLLSCNNYVKNTSNAVVNNSANAPTTAASVNSPTYQEGPSVNRRK